MKMLRLLIVLSLVMLCTLTNAQEIPSYQIKNTDNAEGWRLDSIHYYDFDGMINDSMMVWRDIYTINEYGEKSSVITYLVDLNFTWTPYLKHEFLYDEWQNEISDMVYFWDAVSSVWLAMDRMTKHYHPGDTLIESRATAAFNGSVWEKRDSIYYTRDELNRIDSAISFYAPGGGNIYEPVEIVRKVYNTNNLVSSDTIYEYDNDMWNLVKRSNYYYNSSGNVIDRIRMVWDEGAQDWRNNVRNIFEYDVNQNLTLLEVFDWDGSIPDWIYERYYKHTYDANGNPDLMMIFVWEEDLQDFDHTVTLDHFWGLHVFIGMEDFNTANELTVYPNPAREQVNVSVEEDCELVMLNMSGQQILTTTLTKGNNNIKLSDYPAGTYLLRTRGSREAATFKLLIR